MILGGVAIVLIDIFYVGPERQKDRKKHTKELAESIASVLKENPSWAAEAIDRSQVKLRGESIFLERMGHFYND